MVAPKMSTQDILIGLRAYAEQLKSGSGLPRSKRTPEEKAKREHLANIAICRAKLLGAIAYHNQQLRLIDELGEEYYGRGKAHHRRKIKGCEYGVAEFERLAKAKGIE